MYRASNVKPSYSLTHRTRLRKRRGRYHHERGRRHGQHNAAAPPACAVVAAAQGTSDGRTSYVTGGRCLVTCMPCSTTMLNNVTLELMITINWMERGAVETQRCHTFECSAVARGRVLWQKRCAHSLLSLTAFTWAHDPTRTSCALAAAAHAFGRRKGDTSALKISRCALRTTR